MKQQLLVTAAGEDRPGIVARLTELFVKHGANLEESRMAILGGEFAAIMLITIPDDHVEGLKKELAKLDRETITVSTKKTKALSPERFAGFSQHELTLNGADHEGIVHSVAAHLRDHGINIESMETGVEPAPVTGSPLFKMRAIILVPPPISAGQLESQLHGLGQQLGVDIALSAARKQSAAVR